ncbi:hypothetical protein FKP32DRAFT_1675101 [Trametes sanguinea]|nr:hypothetical protein FKP32DRAFT_1675101 [Trametes sanguinea]
MGPARDSRDAIAEAVRGKHDLFVRLQTIDEMVRVNEETQRALERIAERRRMPPVPDLRFEYSYVRRGISAAAQGSAIISQSRTHHDARRTSTPLRNVVASASPAPKDVAKAPVRLVGGQGLPKHVTDQLEKVREENRAIRELLEEQSQWIYDKLQDRDNELEDLLESMRGLKRNIDDASDVLADAVNNDIPALWGAVDEMRGKLTGIKPRPDGNTAEKAVPAKRRRDTHLEAVVHSVMQHLIGITHSDVPPQNDLAAGVFWTEEPRLLRPRWDSWIENLRAWVPEVLTQIQSQGHKYSL